jgi:Flp pilus assembly pilin Flp
MSRRPKRADFPHMRPSGRTDRICFWRRDEGQTAAEYAVVLGVITPIIALAFITLGDTIAPILDRVTSFL